MPSTPFRIEAVEDGFGLPEIVLPSDVALDRLTDRRVLLEQFNNLGHTVDRNTSAVDLDRLHQQAFDLLRSPAVRDAFDLEREPDRLRKGYGMHRFGQGCLLARRLLQAGVSLVTVYWHYEGPEDSPV